jgi:cyclopropane fatty-acyl-phospholipid synthase-like methyltransferase
MYRYPEFVFIVLEMIGEGMFKELQNIESRPRPFEFYTADDLWTDEYTSQKMLTNHLDDSTDLSSRKSTFIDRSVEWIVSQFHPGQGTKVADFGCGPGLYTTRLAKTQAAITGIDFSKRSIQYARETAAREGLSIQYINKNYLDFDTSDRFDLILMIYCDFCALSPHQRKIMLDRFSTLLKSGGSVLLDVFTLKAFEQREEITVFERNLLNGFWSADEYYGFLNTFKYEKEKVVLDKYSIFEAYRSRTIYNWLQYFSADDIRAEFAASGLEVEAIYSDVAGTPFSADAIEMAVVAKKA